MSGLTDFRVALQQQLSDALEIDFVAGRLEGPIESRDLGSCYVQRVSEVSGNIQEQDMIAIVRVYKKFNPPQDPEHPYDPAPLELVLDQLQASVKAHQTGLPSSWFQRLVSGEIDPADQGVEVAIIGRGSNPAV
jgi:hypothetical protein